MTDSKRPWYRITCPSCGWAWDYRQGKRRRWSRRRVELLTGPYFPKGDSVRRTLTAERWILENPDCARALHVRAKGSRDGQSLSALVAKAPQPDPDPNVAD